MSVPERKDALRNLLIDMNSVVGIKLKRGGNMGNYSVGEKCSGRIINIYQGDWIISLEEGVFGRVLNGAEQASVEPGATVDVVVKQNDDQGILLDFVSVSEQSEVSADGAAKYWNNWENIPAGHGQAVCFPNCSNISPHHLR